METHKLYKTLQKTKYRDWVNRILENNSSDVDPSFLGFMETYEHLSKIIPTSWVVFDFGCAYGFQSYYFRKHRKFVMINPIDRPEFEVFAPSDWCELHSMTTAEFLGKYKDADFMKTKSKFAICNYVPDWYWHSSGKLVRENFDYCYVFYP